MKFGKGRWSNATPCVRNGIKFRSKLEANVYARLVVDAHVQGARLYREVRYPLLNLAPDEHGKPMVFTPDFTMIYPGDVVRVIDAKGRTSPEWARGKAAFEGWYNITVEVVKK